MKIRCWETGTTKEALPPESTSGPCFFCDSPGENYLCLMKNPNTSCSVIFFCDAHFHIIISENYHFYVGEPRPPIKEIRIRQGDKLIATYVLSNEWEQKETV